MANKANKRNIFDNKWALIVVALLLSVLVWVIIAGFVSPGEETTTRNATVNYSYNEAFYRNQNLVIVDMEDLPTMVEVSIRSNDMVWAVDSSNVTVYVDYSAVNGPGTYSLDVKWVSLNLDNYTIVEADPGKINVRFETRESKTLMVEASAPGVEAANGYIKNSLVVTPVSVDISGPASEVERVASVVAVVPDEEIRYESKIYSVTLKLLDADGEELDLQPFTLSVYQVDVEVPILEVRSFPVTVGISGAPEGFDEEWFREHLTLSMETVQVAGKSEDLDKIQSIEAGIIDLSTFDPANAVYDFTISLRSGLRLNEPSLNQVHVTFNATGLTQKTFSVPSRNIRVVNVPAGLTVTPEDGNINVTLMGPTDVINRLLPENIIVEIDAFGLTATQGGRQTVVARIKVAASDRVFAIGTYEVVCDVRTG